MADWLNIKNAKLINPITKRTIVLNDIGINISNIETRVLRAIQNATYKNDNCFVLILDSKIVQEHLKPILEKRNILNTPKNKL